MCVCVSFGPEPRTAAALGGFKVWGEGLVSRPRAKGVRLRVYCSGV